MIKLLIFFSISLSYVASQAQDDSLRRISNNWKSKGNFFLVQKKITPALNAYRKAISLDSTNGIAYYKMCRAHQLLGGDSALYYLKKSFLYTPFLHDTLLLELSHHYLSHGNYALAIQYQQKHNKLHGTDIPFNYQIRKYSDLLDTNFRKKTTLTIPLTSYREELDKIILFLVATKFKCVIKSYYTNHKNSYKNIDESKKNTLLVQRYLISKGVLKNNIKTINYGSSNILVEPKDPLSSKYNNRVEVEILW